MDDNKLEAKLLKIKALAERGEGGEKEAAIKMYHKLLKKYDIDEKALQKDKLSKHWFTYETDIEENLLVQIFYMVTGDPEYFRRTSRTRGTQCGCICTDFEKTEIRFYFEFYKDALNQELEAFLMAFKLKNHLFLFLRNKASCTFICFRMKVQDALFLRKRKRYQKCC